MPQCVRHEKKEKRQIKPSTYEREGKGGKFFQSLGVASNKLLTNGNRKTINSNDKR